VVAHVDVLLGRARAAGNIGRSAVAQKLCERAMRRLDTAGCDDGEVRCRVLITAAYQYSGIGDLPRALSALDQAAGWDPAQHAAVDGTRAMCLARAGENEAALKSFDSAIVGLRDGDRRLLATALLNRGVLHMNIGHLPIAQADTVAARDVAESAGDAWGVFMASHNLGYIQFLSGDLPGALASMESAQQAVEEPPIGVPSMDRARVLLAAGLVSEAAELSELAVQDFDRNRALSELPDALMVAAEADLLQGNWRAAVSRTRRARSLNRRRGHANAALLAELLELKAVAAGRLDEKQLVRARTDARNALRLAVDLAVDLPTDASSAYLICAEAFLDAGDLDSSEAMAAEAAQLSRQPPLATKLHLRLVSARLDLSRNRHAAGLSHIRKGLDDLADFQARFGSQDMQAGAAIHGAALARLGLRTAVSTGSPAAILQWLERSRAATTRLPAVHPPADRELAQFLGQLRLTAIDARAAAVAGAPDPVLERRVADLRRQVRARSWTVSGSGAVQRPLSLLAVQRLLAADPADPTVVALLHGVEELHVLVINARRATSRQLTSWPRVRASIRTTAADLDLLAAPRIPAPVLAVAQRSLAANLALLDEYLLGPIVSTLTDGPLIVAAVGPMATLPWGLLPTLVGRPVSVSSSVTAAMSAGGRPSRAFLRGVLAVAGPDVNGGADEVTTIAGMHSGAGLLLGAAATGEAVLAQLPQGGLLHVAAHGHHEPQSPLFSCMQLADGPLYGYDIAPSPSLPDHVVLSSCDVGRNDVRPGGEPLGFAAALLRSGVSTVVAGVGRIADSVAAQTMVGYHERLLAGDGPAVALAAAITTADGAPAPMTCFGAGS